MCNLAIFLAFGATWVGMGGIIFFICHKIENEYVLKQEKSE